MPMSTVTSKGQTTIPKPIRQYLHLKAHDKINFIPYGKDKVVLSHINGTILDIKGVLRHKVSAKIDFKALREKVRAKVAQEVKKEAE